MPSFIFVTRQINVVIYCAPCCRK